MVQGITNWNPVIKMPKRFSSSDDCRPAKRTKSTSLLCLDSESGTDSESEALADSLGSKFKFPYVRSSEDTAERCYSSASETVVEDSSSSTSETVVEDSHSSSSETLVEDNYSSGSETVVDTLVEDSDSNDDTNSNSTLLCYKNPHPKDKFIRFQDEGHKYWIRGRDKGVISTTTILKTYFEDFNPDPIIRRIMRPSNENYWENPDYQYYRKDASEIKAMWAQLGKDAAEAGTYNHEQIENFYNGLEYDFSKREHTELFIPFHNDHKDYLEPFRTEMLIYHEKLRISGAIDMLYRNRITGKLVLADWKFIKKLAKKNKSKQGKPPLDHLDDTNYTKYSLQLSVYRYILETEYGYEVENQFLVILHGKQKKYRKEVTPYLKDEVEALFARREEQVLVEHTREAMDAMLEELAIQFST